MSALLAAWTPEAASYDISVTVGSTTETLSLSVTIGETYWISGDGSDVAGERDLLSILQTALLTHSLLSSVTVSLSGSRVQILSPTAHVLGWDEAETTFPAEILGFFENTASATLHISPRGSPYVWIPGAPISSDSRDRTRLIRGVAESLSGQVYTCDFGFGGVRREIGWELLHQEVALDEYGSFAVPPVTSWDRFAVVATAGALLRVYEDGLAGNWATYVIAQPPEFRRDGRYQYRWAIDLDLRGSP